MSEEIKNVLIIGSGPAGYSAAVYAARANLKPLLIAGREPGGQLMITTDVENYPGFADPIGGPWLMEQMKQQALNVGTEILADHVVDVDFNTQPYTVKTEGGQKFKAHTLILSTGAKARWLGLPGESKFAGLGVSACATCDGFFFRNRDVCVVGGGNSAVEEALYLANIAKSVTLIHRRDSLRAEKIAQDRLFKNEKVKVIWDSQVVDILGIAHGEEGIPGMTGVRIKNVKSGEESDIAADGLFVAIGHDPATELFVGKVSTDEEKYIIVHEGTKTSVPGVFAAGDVMDKVYRQAVTSAGTGCMAALDAERYLGEKGLI